MRPVFNSYPDQQFILSDALPDNFRGVPLQGGTVTTAQHPEIGTIILQEVKGRQFDMVVSIFNIRKPCSLECMQTPSVLVSLLALKNGLRYTFKELNQLVLQQGEFVLLHSNAQHGNIHFEKAGIYHIIEISWSVKMLEGLLPYFALLRPLQEMKNLRRSFFITPHVKNAGFRSLGMVYSLMRFPYKDANAGYLFDHKIKEYLLTLLMAAEKVTVAGQPVNTNDVNKLQLLHDQLRQHPEKKFPINALAREANMSEKKLKKLFVQLFGMPIFEFHLEIRMNEAHRLLEETNHNTKEIAAMVGYQLTTSFITKFREFFGYAPSEVRKGGY